ncbi:MAG: hypothetical protein PHI26_08750, partial [Atopobiaceae bacterium]|nr:hypothetical protein [Atopobiaceae bacterium]
GCGGGVYSDASSIVLKGGSVCDNSSTSDGGGIYVNHKQTCVTGTTIARNTSGAYGGGIFIDAGGGATVDACGITGNSASQGGGIYDNGTGNTLSGCTITGNHASDDYGGGVYVSSVDNISISGKMEVSGNTAAGDKHANDLHLGANAQRAYISSVPDVTSHIGIYSTLGDGGVLSKEGTHYTRAFFSDVDGWYVDWVDAAAGGSRELLWKKGPASGEPGTITVSPAISQTGKDYNGSPLVKGTFSFPSNSDSVTDLSSVFYYSDGLFAADAKTYDVHLATMSMDLAMSAFGTNAGNDTGDYSNRFTHVRQLLADIGCDDAKTYISDTYTTKPTTDTIGVAISQKQISVNGGDYTLVPIAIRGANYESEWASNVTVGTSGEEAGFASAADQVTDQVEAYIKGDPALLERARSGKVKFWVVGYSRAGATANLTSKRLVDGIHIYDDADEVYTGNQVYGYCFEDPQGGVSSAEVPGYDYSCIHNLINKSDIVPLVAMSQMGFKRYGVDHYVPGDAAGSATGTYAGNTFDNTAAKVSYVGGSAYLTQRPKMLAQLTAVDHGFQFDDYFNYATINYLGSTFHVWDMVTAISGKTGLTEDYEESLMERLQAWSFGGDATSYRNTYATRKCTLCGSDETLQTAVSHLAALYFSLSPSQVSGIGTAMSCAMVNVEETKLYFDVVGKWQKLSVGEKEKWINDLWAIFIQPTDESSRKNGSYIPSVSDYLTDYELTCLKRDWPVIADWLLTFVSEDYECGDALGTGRGQVYLGSLLYNSTTITQGHNYEVNLSWLRSYDDFYADDTTAVTVDTSGVTVTAPTASLAEGPITGDDPLALGSTNVGGSIYYRVRMQAAGHDVTSEWKLYRDPIPLPMYGSRDTTYTVETYAMAYGKRSPTASFTYTLGKRTLTCVVAR